MPLRALVVAWLLLALAGARAQAVEITVPPDRFAGPGEYVTLVFRLASVETLEVDVSVDTERGWPILRQPGTVRLQAGQSTPVVATVEVPSDATAFSEDRVRLRVTTPSERLERVVVLTVTERIDLDLQAPREVTLGVDGLTVTAVNRGNAADAVAVALWRGADVLDRRELTLEPGARVELTFDLRDAGSHTVVLTSARGAEVRRGVTVLRFGTPEPAPFALAADLTLSIDSGGSWRSTFTAKGLLSDFAALDARIDAPGWQRSFAELTLESGSLRIGGGWRDPFGLRLPAAFGVAGTLRRGDWGLAAAVGHVADDRFSGVIAGSWSAPNVTLAGGLGAAEGAPLLALRVEHATAEVRMTGTAGYARRAWAGGVAVEARDDRGVADLELAASGIAPGAGRVDLRARYRIGDDTFFGDATWYLDGSNPWAGRLGANVALATPLPGSMRLALQAGSRESFGQVAYRADLGAGWNATNALGARWDDAGFGVVLDSSWSRFAASYLAADVRLVYRPATGGVDGRVGVRTQADLEAWSVAASGVWDLSGRTLGASVDVAWRDEPWRVEVGASASYGLAAAPADRWSARLSLAGGYAFTIPVDPAVAEAFGGRRVGVLAGRVAVGDEGLPGVVIEIGRYRVLTDEAGAFRLELPPGATAGRWWWAACRSRFGCWMRRGVRPRFA